MADPNIILSSLSRLIGWNDTFFYEFFHPCMFLQLQQIPPKITPIIPIISNLLKSSLPQQTDVFPQYFLHTPRQQEVRDTSILLFLELIPILCVTLITSEQMF